MLKTVGLTKEYEATVALSPFDFEISSGEVVGVVGENGAGKSTLMKLLAGVVQPSGGQIVWGDSDVQFRNTIDSSKAGIEIVHQELNIIPTLSVEDNLFLGQERGVGLINRSETRLLARNLLDKVGAKFLPTIICEDLSIAEQQLVEIAKALSKEAKLIIFDEPTAVLSEPESEKLFNIIGALQRDGVAVLYVSHRLPEILRICSRIVVLRDGVKVSDQKSEGLTESDLANLMVGRKLEDIFPAKTETGSETILDIVDIWVPGFANGITLSVRSGEILGLAGLIGSGRTETCEAIFGVRQGKGTVKVGGKALVKLTIANALAAGIAYVSEDRKGKGLVSAMSIDENICLACLRDLNSASKRKVTAAQWIDNLKIKVSDSSLSMTSLSGGNQQKCSVAKWLETKPRVIILDEPTRGIDVGSKAEMYRLIGSLAAKGLAIIVISSEMPEIIGLAHRVAVFRDGSIVGELKGQDMTESGIMALAAGVRSGMAA
jgi:ABC-type sugar transport system ATPase subunit